MKLILTCLLSFLLLACEAIEPVDSNPTASPEVPGNIPGPVKYGTYTPIGVAGTIATPEERARCEAAGGVIERAGLLGAERCTQNFSDGGKACRNADDCIGQCKAYKDKGPMSEVSGQCAMNDNPFGCYALIEDGRSQGMLCVD